MRLTNTLGFMEHLKSYLLLFTAQYVVFPLLVLLKFKVVFEIFFAQLTLHPISLQYVFVHTHAVLVKGRNSFETIVAFDGGNFFPVVFFP
jgi:hypothetical protein